MTGKCIFTIDVEDWFHILDLDTAPPVSEWSGLPSRIESNLYRLFELLSAADVHATCFFLGWVAERYPGLVRVAKRLGHEIASHGSEHRLVYQMDPLAFRRDAERARLVLEDTAGCSVAGFRAPGFSVTSDTPWFFDELARAGYEYDSSVFPASRAHGGLKTDRRRPFVVDTAVRPIVEFPITVETVLGKPLCFFGGGYLRLFPKQLISTMARKVLQGGRPVIFYIHPRDIDSNQRRIPMGLIRRTKTYLNLDTAEEKVQSILHDFSFETMGALAAQMAKASTPPVLNLADVAAVRTTA